MRGFHPLHRIPTLHIRPSFRLDRHRLTTTEENPSRRGNATCANGVALASMLGRPNPQGWNRQGIEPCYYPTTRFHAPYRRSHALLSKIRPRPRPRRALLRGPFLGLGVDDADDGPGWDSDRANGIEDRLISRPFLGEFSETVRRSPPADVFRRCYDAEPIIHLDVANIDETAIRHNNGESLQNRYLIHKTLLKIGYGGGGERSRVRAAALWLCGPSKPFAPPLFLSPFLDDVLDLIAIRQSSDRTEICPFVAFPIVIPVFDDERGEKIGISRFA